MAYRRLILIVPGIGNVIHSKKMALSAQVAVLSCSGKPAFRPRHIIDERISNIVTFAVGHLLNWPEKLDSA
jgi:hypothetical protein